MMTRREFSKSILAGGTALLASENLFSVGPQASPQKSDLLIKGGTVIDPGQRLHAPMDVLVNDGKILEVSRDIPESRALQVFSAKDKIVTPGFIDLHVHCYYGVSDEVDPDQACLSKGTTTVVDAGSNGYVAMRRFIMDIVDTSKTRVYAMIALAGQGFATGTPLVMEHLDKEDPELTVNAARKNKPTVVAIKVHLSQSRSTRPKDLELGFVKRGIAVAEAAGLPMAVHIQNTYHGLPVIVKLLRKGDVSPHCFNGIPQDKMIDANGKIWPEVLEARNRGVIFDVAEGPTHPHISFDVAEKCLQQGFLPDTISSGINGDHQYATNLSVTASKFLALGMNLDQVIERVTIKPTQVFNFGVQIGTLRPGSEADIGIFELRDGRFEFTDGVGGKRVGRQKLTSTAVVCRGNLTSNAI